MSILPEHKGEIEMNPPKIYHDKLEKLIELNNKAQRIKFDIWKDHVVFTGHWWGGVCLTIIPWILWYCFRKKNSTSRLLFVGFFAMQISILFDFLGTKLGLWFYYYDVIPFMPAFFPWDITLIPILLMTIIQIKPKLNPYIKSLIFSVIASYVAEPLFSYFGYYRQIKWDYFYSFLIYYCIFLIADFLSRRKTFENLS
jgi:hypothetical protein